MKALLLIHRVTRMEIFSTFHFVELTEDLNVADTYMFLFWLKGCCSCCFKDVLFSLSCTWRSFHS